MAGELRIKVRWKARKGAAVIEETFDYTDDGLAQFCNQVEGTQRQLSHRGRLYGWRDRRRINGNMAYTANNHRTVNLNPINAMSRYGATCPLRPWAGTAIHTATICQNRHNTQRRCTTRIN